MTNYDVFQQWLDQCPVPFDYLSEDKSDGQIAYVFHPNVRDDDYDTFSDKVVTCEELEEQSIK